MGGEHDGKMACRGADVTKAAGILFVSINGNCLFLRRTATARDFPGAWDFPGGGAEGNETAEETALREAREEIGFLPEGKRVLHTRTSSVPSGVGVSTGPAAVSFPGPPAGSVAASPDVDFSTFLQKVTNEFTPELNDEHDGWAWAPMNAPPAPLHPGCQIALDRISMDELGVARAIADGRLTSPQRYQNVMLWAIRITGTGAAFRPKINELVYRDEEIHLHPDMLARCNGLPVLFKHPQKGLLNSEEFGNRVVGMIFLPYVAGDEVWGIAKIYDDEANRLMDEEDLSTSPGVNFENYKVNRTLRLEDGKKVLIEGNPDLVDHVAICELGVWDKGEPPSGIRSESREDSAMTEDEKKAAEDKAKKDAEDKAEKEKADAKMKADADAGTALDKKLTNMLDAVSSCMDRLDSIGKRMDAWDEEKKKADAAAADAAKADQAKGDAAKKDGEPTEAEKLAADKAKKDADERKKRKRKKPTPRRRKTPRIRPRPIPQMSPDRSGTLSGRSKMLPQRLFRSRTTIITCSPMLGREPTTSTPRLAIQRRARCRAKHRCCIGAGS